MKTTTKKLSKSQQWFADNVGYDHFKTGNKFIFDKEEYIVVGVSIAKNELEFRAHKTLGYNKYTYSRRYYFIAISTNQICNFTVGPQGKKIMDLLQTI